MTHPSWVAENCAVHPIPRAQKLMTHPISASAHPTLYFFTSPLSINYLLPCVTKGRYLLFVVVLVTDHTFYVFLLQTAGNAVKRAADNLVTAAKNAAIFEEQETTVIINQRFVGGIAQELEAQEKILRIEKELAAARNKLSQIRQAKYRAEEDD